MVEYLEFFSENTGFAEICLQIIQKQTYFISQFRKIQKIALLLIESGFHFVLLSKNQPKLWVSVRNYGWSHLVIQQRSSNHNLVTTPNSRDEGIFMNL